MRVLAVTESLPTTANPAAGRFIWRHIEALSTWADVHPVHLLLTRQGAAPTVRIGSRDLGGRRVIELIADGPPLLAEIAAARALSRLLVTVGADVLHSMAMESLLVAAATRRRGVPWVHSEHSSNVTDPPSGLVGRYVRGLRSALRRPLLVTAVSAFLADGVASLGRTRLTSVVPNVVDVPPARTARRASAEPLLIAVGALVASKRPMLALATLAELRSRGVPARLTWVGTGPLAGRFDEDVARLGLSGVARRHPFCPPEEYAALLRDADVFFLPTAFETFCVSAAEAIASGVPAVVGGRGGQRDFVGPGSGRLVDGGSAGGYADAISEVLAADPALPRAASVAEVRRAFSLTAVADAFLGAYRDAGVQADGRLP
jgi:glycosyltransferase involved in cell wall biosynthesis